MDGWLPGICGKTEEGDHSVDRKKTFSYALCGFCLILAVFVCPELTFSQATPPSAPPQIQKPVEQPPATEPLTPYQKSQLERAFNDWPWLAKYRDADKELPLPAA